MQAPLFSLIIPMWNVAPYLPPLWESLTCQDLSSAEIIFINDGSPDDSADYIEKRIQNWQASHPQLSSPFKLITQENSGVGVARNRGLEMAQGKYIWFIDSDDLMAPGALKTLQEACDNFPTADCIFFPFIQLQEENHEKVHQFYEINWKNTPCFDLKLPQRDLQKTNEPLFLQQPAPWNKIYRREFILSNEGSRFAKNLWYEDLQFFANMLALKPTWIAIEQPLYAYRLRPGSTMHNKIDPRNFDIHQILKNIEIFYFKMNVQQEFAIGLEAINAYHGYLAPMTRLIQAKASASDRNKIKLWMLQNCPNCLRNPLLSRKQKLLGFLYAWNLGWLIRFILK